LGSPVTASFKRPLYISISINIRPINPPIETNCSWYISFWCTLKFPLIRLRIERDRGMQR
jgi:hypothetical protein